MNSTLRLIEVLLDLIVYSSFTKTPLRVLSHKHWLDVGAALSVFMCVFQSTEIKMCILNDFYLCRADTGRGKEALILLYHNSCL